MQKRLLIFVMLLMMFWISGCNNADFDSDVKVNTSKDDEVDSRDVNETISDTEVEITASPVEEIKTVEEINREILLNSEFHDYLFQIGEVLYDYKDEHLLQKLIDNGFEIKGGMGYISEWGSTIELNNRELGVSCKIYVESTSDEPQKYTDGKINTINFGSNYSFANLLGSRNEKVYFFKGIHTGMLKGELEEIMGVPTKQEIEETYDFSTMNPQIITRLKYEYTFYVGYAEEKYSGRLREICDSCYFYFDGDDVLVSMALFYDKEYFEESSRKREGEEWTFVPAETVKVLHDIE